MRFLGQRSEYAARREEAKDKTLRTWKSTVQAQKWKPGEDLKDAVGWV